MEPPNQDDAEGDSFSDAVEDFQSNDCDAISDQSDQPISASTLSEPSPPISSPATTLRRRSRVSSAFSKELDADSSSIKPERFHDCKTRFVSGKRYKLYRDGNESTRPSWDLVDSDRVDSVEDKKEVEETEMSTVTMERNDEQGCHSVDSAVEPGDSADSSFLLFIAGLVIKAIGYQLNVFIYFIKLPMLVLYWSFVCVIDPFGAIRRSRGFIMGKMVSLCQLVGGAFGLFINDWLKEHEPIWNFFLRFGWGLFWSAYVCIVLCGLLLFSIMFSGFLMRYLVEKPMQMKEVLNFDYTMNSPAALVPIISCSGVGCGANCMEEVGGMKSASLRVIPNNHKLQTTILLTLPESEYNKKLGIFQVRVDFISVDGKILASKSHPCMLKFKSEPIRLLLTLFKMVPLVAGYMSESQNVELKMRGFTEGHVSTSCLRVSIEQRAEFPDGAGIPEIYDASLTLESELPFFKRIIWCWKKTLFVWIAMVLFTVELVFALICCGAIIIPRRRREMVLLSTILLQTISDNKVGDLVSLCFDDNDRRKIGMPNCSANLVITFTPVIAALNDGNLHYDGQMMRWMKSTGM